MTNVDCRCSSSSAPTQMNDHDDSQAVAAIAIRPQTPSLCTKFTKQARTPVCCLKFRSLVPRFWCGPTRLHEPWRSRPEVRIYQRCAHADSFATSSPENRGSTTGNYETATTCHKRRFTNMLKLQCSWRRSGQLNHWLRSPGLTDLSVGIDEQHSRCSATLLGQRKYRSKFAKVLALIFFRITDRVQ